MKKALIGRIITGIAALIGVITSVYLIGVHVDIKTGGALDGGFCDVAEGVNCIAAAESGWSEILGIPIALLGLAFYVGAFFIALLHHRFPERKPVLEGPGILLTLFLLSTAYSFVLAAVSLIELDAICPACFTLYFVNIIGLIGASVWTRTNPFSALAHQIRGVGNVARQPALLVLIGLGVLTLIIGMVRIGATVEGRIANERASIEAEPPVSAENLRAEHAPSKGGGADAPIVIVEFSNYTCPFCARLAESVDTVLGDSDDDVRLEFRPFPRVGQAESERAARAAHCASEQGRFAELHAALFANAETLSEDDIAGFAREAGLDENVLLDCMESERIADLINIDLNAGRSIGVQGTPTYFINGRRYEGFATPAELRRQIQSARSEIERAAP